MDNNDNLYDNTISQIQGASQAKTSEALLSRLPKNKPPMELWNNYDIPKIAFQGIQGGYGNAPQNIVENPLMTAMGGLPSVQAKSGAEGITGIASLLGAKNPIKPETTFISDKLMNPQSLVGKGLGLISNIVGGAGMVPKWLGGGEGIAPLAREATGVPAAERAVETTGKSLKNVAQRSEALSYDASQDIPKASEAYMKSKNAEFGSTFKNLESNMTPEKYNEVLNKTSIDLGEDVSHDATMLKNHQAQIMSSESPVLSKEYTQAMNSKIFGSLSPRGQAIYLKNFLDSIDKNIPGLREAKDAIRPAYEAVTTGRKILKQGRFKEIATGDLAKIGTREIGDLASAEKQFGTTFTKQASKLGEENQNLLKQQIANQSNLANKRATAKGVGTAVAGGAEYLGLNKFLDMIRGKGNREQNKISS